MEKNKQKTNKPKKKKKKEEMFTLPEIIRLSSISFVVWSYTQTI